MFGFFKKSKAQKINVEDIANQMSKRFWKIESVDKEHNRIVVVGKYRNLQRDFYKLYLHFFGGNVRFSDQRGRFISEVPQNKMYTELKDIMNVL